MIEKRWTNPLVRPENLNPPNSGIAQFGKTFFMPDASVRVLHYKCSQAWLALILVVSFGRATVYSK